MLDSVGCIPSRAAAVGLSRGACCLEPSAEAAGPARQLVGVTVSQAPREASQAGVCPQQ